MPPLQARAITKRFGSQTVLHDVDLQLAAGEVLALMGGNGAGKSTLMKILAGIYTDYEGTLLVRGEPARFHSVLDAEAAGIAIIHQELNLVPELSVAANMFLGREPKRYGVFLDQAAARRAAQQALAPLGVPIDADAKVGTLRVGEQQLVEIAKALSIDARVLIMDEPTSALSSAECEILFAVVRRLIADGVAVIYVSHRLDEVMALAHRTTILRDGRHVLTAPLSDLTRDDLVSAMVGRAVGDVRRASETVAADVASAPVVLSVRDLSYEVPTLHGVKSLVRDVSFDVRRGEILGIGGLLGAGRTEILESIFGANIGRRGGTIAIDGRQVEITDPIVATDHGLALVTEDRKTNGLLLGASIRENIILPSLGSIAHFALRRFQREAAVATHYVRELAVRCTGIEQTSGSLSGGNQQKVVIAKWLATGPRVLLLDEPTRGIDVGAKREIYDLIFALAEQGMAIIVVSSELPELIALSERILVMCEGRPTGVLERKEFTEARIMDLASRGVRHKGWAA